MIAPVPLLSKGKRGKHASRLGKIGGLVNFHLIISPPFLSLWTLLINTLLQLLLRAVKDAMIEFWAIHHYPLDYIQEPSLCF